MTCCSLCIPTAPAGMLFVFMLMMCIVTIDTPPCTTPNAHYRVAIPLPADSVPSMQVQCGYHAQNWKATAVAVPTCCECAAPLCKDQQPRVVVWPSPINPNHLPCTLNAGFSPPPFLNAHRKEAFASSKAGCHALSATPVNGMDARSNPATALFRERYNTLNNDRCICTVAFVIKNLLFYIQ